MRTSTTRFLDSPRIAPWVVLVSALLLFSINLDRPPHPDELHHVIAAKGLLETGKPQLAEGEYWRGMAHTWLVAASYATFGEGLPSARLPAVLFEALVAVILFIWVRREVGVLAAWITAALFISSPFTIEIAQFSRFYALQTFAFTLGTALLYFALTRSTSIFQRVLQGIASVCLFAFAVSLQVTTLVGVLGVGIWAAGTLARRTVFNPQFSSSMRRTIALGIGVCALIVAVSLAFTGVLASAWEQYATLPLHAASRAGQFWYYYLRFLLYYPTLWTLFGVLAILAVLRTPRLAWLGIAIFGVSFLVMSFAAWKATRYLSFSIPFLTIVWGIALSEVLSIVRVRMKDVVGRLAASMEMPRAVGAALATSLIVGTLVIAIIGNPFWLRTAAIIGNIPLPGETPTPDWRLARDALSPWVSDAEIVITTEELGAIYFLGRSDVRLSQSKLGEIRPDQRFEFGIDHRTGRPVISTPDSLEKLINCFRSGVIVGPIQNWGDPTVIGEDIQEILKREAFPISVPKSSYLYAWGWKRQASILAPTYCSSLAHFSGRDAT